MMLNVLTGYRRLHVPIFGLLVIHRLIELRLNKMIEMTLSQKGFFYHLNLQIVAKSSVKRSKSYF